MQIRQVSIRAVLPFRLDCLDGDFSLDTILTNVFRDQQATWLGLDNDGGEQKVAHSEYMLEYLPHVNRFLFHSAGITGCRYLKLSADRLPRAWLEPSEVWTNNLSPRVVAKRLAGVHQEPTPRGLQLIGLATDESVWKPREPANPDKERLPLFVTVDPDCGVEMWISQLGAGVLSLSLRCHFPTAENVDEQACFRGLLHLNHCLATAQDAVWLRPVVAHAGQVEATVSASDQAAPATVPSAADGARQHLHQFLRDLMRPLWDRAHVHVRFDLRGIVYTGIEIQNWDDQPDTVEAELRAWLSQLAQVHPRSHPGEGASRHAAELRINDRHRCALSLNGAAHASLLPLDPSQADQARLRRIGRNYFSGYLLAQLQRGCLQGMLDESTSISHLVDGGQLAARHDQLLEKVLRFGLEGEFVQACWRSTLQEHHEQAQLVCRVHEGLAAVRQAMSDFDRMATERAARQLRVDAELAAQHRHEESERSERTMHVLEIFIVTFYSVELAHILGESFGFGHSPMVAWTLIGVAVGTFSMATMLVMSKWLRKAGTICTVLCLFLLSSVIQGGFLTFNGWWKQQQEQLAPAAPGTAKESKAATTGHEH